jgi:hypothetical protein
MMEDGSMKLTVTIWLEADDLNAIAQRYEQEYGEEPKRKSRAFKAYCRDMVGYAVGAAGAGGWEEGLV